MKTLIYFILILTFSMSCSREDKILIENCNSSIGTVCIEDFKSYPNFLSEGKFEEMVDLEEVVLFGDSYENAAVPLVFDKEGHLYSPSGFQVLLDNLVPEDDSDNDDEGKEDLGPNVYFIDLKSYEEVVGEFDLSDYAYQLDSTFFGYDPYATHEYTREETFALLNEENFEFLAKRKFLRGDIIQGKKGGKFGHASLGYKSDKGNLNSKNTSILEANKGSVKKVQLRPYKESWKISSVREVYHYDLKRLSTKRRNRIVKYARKQLGEKYWIGTPKWSGRRWYCSKLVWKAYKKKGGYSVDYNWGYWVSPQDIKMQAKKDTRLNSYYHSRK